MTVTQLIQEFERVGVSLWEEGGQLRFRAPKNVMTPERKEALRKTKDEVLKHLKERAQAGVVVPNPGQRYQRFPLTDVQAAYLFGRGDAFAYGGSACQVYTEVTYPHLDDKKAEDGWNRLIERHDMLRCTVHADGFQQVLPSAPRYEIAVSDLRGATQHEVERHLAKTRAEMDHHVYEPDVWPLFELRITQTAQKVVLHASIDFLCADYLSIQLLMMELDDYCFGDTRDSARPLEISFRDYLLAERGLRETASYQRDRDYWMQRVPSLPAAPELPLLGEASNTDQGARFTRLQTRFAEGDLAALKSQAAKRGLTTTVAVLGAYAEVIGRWSRRPQFTLNLTLLNRLPLHPEVANLVGDFTTVSLLEVDQKEALSFQERVARLGKQLFTDMDHRLFSGIEMMRELSRTRDRGEALMPIVFTSTIGLTEQERLRGELSYSISQTPQLWIDCQAVEDRGRLTLSWDVRQGLFPPGVAEDMFGALETLLRVLMRGDGWDAASPVDLPIEQMRVRQAVNATQIPRKDQLLYEEFLRRAQETPERAAVVTPLDKISYGDLALRAQSIARTLQAEAVKKGDVVAVVLDKGVEQIAAVIGTLLAGAVYLPIDLNQPPERRARILGNAGAVAVLVDPAEAVNDRWPEGLRRVSVAAAAGHTSEVPWRPSIASTDELAYIIYTSGSTGEPKGVQISHRAALNTITDINQRFEVSSQDVVLGLANMGFDLSVFDVFGTLAAGACLVLPDPELRGDPSHIAELITTHRVSVWNSVPAQLQLLLDALGQGGTLDLSGLRLVMLSGDWIPINLPEEARKLAPRARIVSLGGATEASIWSIYHVIDSVHPSWRSIPYGKPLGNQRFHVLDSHLRDCPVWGAGELFIAGHGLSLGYFGDAERTNERFLKHPRTGERIYRTGDFGRYWPDGTIEFLGREDRQVKIRGHRIELAEVESAMLTHPAVNTATVLLDGKGSSRRLVGFAELARAHVSEPDGSRAQLAARARAAGEKVREGFDGERFVEFVGLLDRAALLSMCAALRSCGLFETSQSRHTADEVIQLARVARKHDRLIRGWLLALVEEGKLELDEHGRHSMPTQVTRDDVTAIWDTITDRDLVEGFNEELLSYMRMSQEHLVELMRDEMGAVEMVFPEGTTDVWQGAYSNNILSKYVNRSVTAALTAIAEQRKLEAHGRAPLRVLEIGGGVGGITSELVSELSAFDVEYLFTDVSQFFLNDAKQRYADQPWVRHGLFDLNRDYREQGFRPNSFDVIVSAHVMHYARNAPRALARLRELLAPGGWLVFIDMTREGYQVMTSMMFLGGDTPDFEDMRRGQYKTFVTPTQWLHLFREAGGETVLELPHAQDVFAPLGQKVFAVQFKRDRYALSEEELTAHLAQRLPEYMVPPQLQLVDALPLTSNGKVDRRTLTSWVQHERAEQASATGELHGSLERTLARVWGELLGLPAERIGRDDDFFQLGGDSLLAARLVGRLREEVPEAGGMFWDSMVRTFMPQPTIAALAAQLSRATQATQHKDSEVADSPVVALTSAVDEEPFVLLHDLTGALHAYRQLVPALEGTHVLGLHALHRASPLLSGAEISLDGLASSYVQALQPMKLRRLHLVGFHSGGVLALEVARQWLEMGYALGSLSVVSAYPMPMRVEHTLLQEYLFGRSLGLSPDFFGLGDERALGSALQSLRRTNGEAIPAGALEALGGDHAALAEAFAARARLAEEARSREIFKGAEAIGVVDSEAQFRHLKAVHSALARTLRAAQLSPIACDINLFVHTGETEIWPPIRSEMEGYWRDLCLGDLRVLELPGDHFSCMDAAGAALAAQHLKALRS